MLKSIGVVDHALFDTITHLSQGECHPVSLPPFFFFFYGILELLKSMLSLMWQVSDLTASGKAGEEVSHLFPPCSPFFLVFLC